jgi:ribosomal protein S19E (S16A)
MKALEPCRKLCSKLKGDIKNLESLYGERSSIKEKIEAIQTRRGEISDEMFEHLSNSGEVAKLCTMLDTEDRKLKPLDGRLERTGKTHPDDRVGTSRADPESM